MQDNSPSSTISDTKNLDETAKQSENNSQDSTTITSYASYTSYRKQTLSESKPTRLAFGKHAIIEDPDGYLISIAEMKSKPGEEFDLLGLLGAE